MVDFKILKKSFVYSDLDLSGAGWCMCLPREGGYIPIPTGQDQEPEPGTPDLEPLDPEQPQSPTLFEELGQKPGMGMDVVDNRL